MIIFSFVWLLFSFLDFPTRCKNIYCSSTLSFLFLTAGAPVIKTYNMKKILLFIPLLVMLFVTACETPSLPGVDLTEVKDQIATINQQIEAMQKTLDLLKQTDSELKKSIEELKSAGEDTGAVAELQKKQKELEEQIKSVENTINSTKDWASKTFATLDQQNNLSKTLASLSETVTALQNKVDGISGNLTKLIDECTSSLKTWVNEQLSGYCTLAQAQATVEAMQKTVSDSDKALQAEIDALKKELQDMETRLTEAYKKAIEEAVKNNGTIPPTGDIDGANKDLATLLAEVNAKIAALESRVNEIEKKLSDLVNRVQSVNWAMIDDFEVECGKTFPYYDTKDIVRLGFLVSPKSVVDDLAKNYQNVLSFDIIANRAELINDEESFIPTDFYNVPVSACKADSKNGVLTVDLAVKDIPEEIFMQGEAETAYHTIMLSISDANTQIQSSTVWFESGYYSDTYPTKGSWDPEYLDRKGGTWQIDKEKYGIGGEEIIAVGTSLELYTNADNWLTADWNKETGEVSVTVKDNNVEDRSEYIYIFTKTSWLHITYKQYCEDWSISADKQELKFSYAGGEDQVVITAHEDAVLEYEYDADWLYVSRYGYDYDSKVIEFSVEQQRELSESKTREAIVKIKDNRGNSVDVKVAQELLTAEEATIKADKQEIRFPYAGGTETITLTHPKNAEIRFDYASWEVDCQLTQVTETTSTLTVSAGENRHEEPKEYILLLSAHFDGIYMNMPVTEIKVTQAGPGVTISELAGIADNTEVLVYGQIVARYARGFMMSDETGDVLVYEGTSPLGYDVGAKVLVKALKTQYRGQIQLSSVQDVNYKGSDDVNYPTPLVITSENINSLDPSVTRYIQYTGKLALSGNYYNITIAGTEIQGSVESPDDDIKNVLSANDGATITVRGYYTGTSTSAGVNYLNTLVTEVTM